jgi:hypothetical protein
MSQATFGRLTGQRQEEIRQGRWGSLYGAGTPSERAEAQQIALKESRVSGHLAGEYRENALAAWQR